VPLHGPHLYSSLLKTRQRQQEEKQKLPQLIIIDGGKGQLSSALKSLERLGLRGKITVVGIAKKLEEIYFPDDSVPLYLDKRSESLKLIQYLRNEAHRFGITHHRNKRSKNLISSELDHIKGIGEKSKQKLFQHFKTINKIKQANLNQLCNVLDKSKAKLVFNYFHMK
jgi:excinuclease ABC subunit C